MKDTQIASFPTGARRHSDWWLRRFVEPIAAALAIAAFAYAGLFLVAHFNEAMDLAAQSRAAAREIYYPNCAAARAAGAAPMIAGHPGYRPELDADGDGIACEPYRPLP